MIKPYYEHAGITIYHGDCREVMPQLGKFDMVLTDPPWNLDFFRDDKKEWSEYAAWLDGIKQQCERAADVVWIFQSTKAVAHIAYLFAGWGMFASAKNFCQMIKGKIPNAFDLAFYNSNNGYCGNARNWHIGHNNLGGENSSTLHPTARPLDTITYILSMYKHQTILDPFMGSGTTLRAAKDLGRRAVGIEIEEKYCEVAARRMGQEVLEFKS